MFPFCRDTTIYLWNQFNFTVDKFYKNISEDRDFIPFKT
jgi:hypothetical protein